MELNELIKRISFIRTRANLSARKLSMDIDKTKAYISHLESRKNFAPTFETLMDILDVCNTTVEEFFYYSIPSYNQDKELIELLRTTSSEKKQTALSVLKLR